jgi:hypothetical protein
LRRKEVAAAAVVGDEGAVAGGVMVVGVVEAAGEAGPRGQGAASARLLARRREEGRVRQLRRGMRRKRKSRARRGMARVVRR